MLESACSPRADSVPYAISHSLQCRRCHARKTRCSGTFPCQFCAGRNLECIYDEAGASIGQTKPETGRLVCSESSISRSPTVSKRKSPKFMKPRPPSGCPGDQTLPQSHRILTCIRSPARLMSRAGSNGRHCVVQPFSQTDIGRAALARSTTRRTGQTHSEYLL